MRPKSPNRPRRQAKQKRALETVDAILEAAARVLAEQGYAAASTSRIADVAGVSIGTLYEYFENRDAVFDVLIDRELEKLVDVFGQAAAENRRSALLDACRSDRGRDARDAARPRSLPRSGARLGCEVSHASR